jgi:TolB-like protein
MVRRDGYVKLLDFGLAKLTGLPDSITDTEAPTKAMVNTGAGTVMGTANYMSPEQAKGTHVDARTDLWSLGAVLYEMITGHVPFPGETPTETISLILQRDPPPLTRYTNEVPAELERIVGKALTKNRDERYQSAKDLMIDLRNLKRKLEVDAEIDRTAPPALGSTSSGQRTPATASGSVAATAPASAHAASSAEYIVSGIKQHKLPAAIAVIMLLIGGVGLGFYLHARNPEAAIDSIAVLPFANTNGDPNTEYLSDGITESIISSLSQLSQLRVMARSTVLRYKGKDVDPQKVGHDLGVGAVLTGRLIQQGDNLTIRTELVNVSDGTELWGQQYNRKLSDALVLEEEIAKEISNLIAKLF